MTKCQANATDRTAGGGAMPDFPITCSVRRRRVGAGLSQGALAREVGVSRQALAAIEAARQVPSTTLALQLARALHCGVEDLFSLVVQPELRALLASGSASGATRLALARVDDRWVAHPIEDGERPGDGLLCGEPGPGGEIAVEPLLEPADLERNVLVAGCAPILGVLAGGLARYRSDARGTWIPADSTRALELLEAGLVHMAGLHLVDVSTPGGHADIVRDRLPGQSMLIIHLTRWRQGLVVSPGNPLGIHDVAEVLRPGVRWARRDSGSAAQQLGDRLLALEGLKDEHLSPGPRASGHREVGRFVGLGLADVGIAIEPIALAEGLDFVPLAEERFDLVVPAARRDVPAVARLIELIERPVFRSDAGHLAGYDLAWCGQASIIDSRSPE